MEQNCPYCKKPYKMLEKHIKDCKERTKQGYNDIKKCSSCEQSKYVNIKNYCIDCVNSLEKEEIPSDMEDLELVTDDSLVDLNKIDELKKINIDYEKLEQNLLFGEGTDEGFKDSLKDIEQRYKINDKNTQMLIMIQELLKEGTVEQDWVDSLLKPKSIEIKQELPQTSVKTTTKQVCSFRINPSDFKEFLTILTSKGYEADSSSATTFINDCILRIDGNKIWTIVSDKMRKFVCQAKLTILDVENPADIPIEIATMLKWLGTFGNSSLIEVVYDNGLIGMRDISSKTEEFNMNTRMIYATKRKESIQNDLIVNLSFGPDTDKKLIEAIKKNGNSIYIKTDDEVTLFYGVKLPCKFVMPADQMRKIMDDGERIGNRSYPFNFLKNSVEINIKSTDVSEQAQITREILPKEYKIKDEFSLTFTARLTNAVNNINGNTEFYTNTSGPMTILSKNKSGNLEICYLVNIFKQT